MVDRARTTLSGLWQGARRLPYFFTYTTTETIPWGNEGLFREIPKEWVLCPQCALEHAQDERITARYTTIRSAMCCRCGIVMGPINQSEMEAGEDE